MTIEINVDLSLYPVEAVMGSAYVFTERCYVLLDKPGEGTVHVSLTAKPGATDDDLRNIAGDFQNELLGQALRLEIGKRHERLRELLLARALFGAAPRIGEPAEQPDALTPHEAAPGGDPPVDDLPEDEPDFDDYLDDPLGIAVPWEEKFPQRAAEAAASGQAAAAAAAEPDSAVATAEPTASPGSGHEPEAHKPGTGGAPA